MWVDNRRLYALLSILNWVHVCLLHRKHQLWYILTYSIYCHCCCFCCWYFAFIYIQNKKAFSYKEVHCDHQPTPTGTKHHRVQYGELLSFYLFFANLGMQSIQLQLQFCCIFFNFFLNFFIFIFLPMLNYGEGNVN